MISPILKYYYNLFNYGKQTDKLNLLKDYFKMHFYMRRDITVKESDKNLVLIANITDLVVDNNNKGYALLDVQVFENKYSEMPFQLFSDLATIDNGVLHTWFPYDRISFFDYSSKGCPYVGMDLEYTDNYITDKALEFSQKVCKNPNLWNDIAQLTSNGVYTNESFENLCFCIKNDIARFDFLDTNKYLNDSKEKEPLSFVEVVDQLGLDLNKVNEPKENSIESKTGSSSLDIPEAEIIEAEFFEKSETIENYQVEETSKTVKQKKFNSRKNKNKKKDTQ